MFIKNVFKNLSKYSFLIEQLVQRDFKIKYKRSILGVVWSLLYPLLMMSVMAIVFSKMFKFSVPGTNYLVYLMIGLVFFNYFSEATNLAMGSIVGNFSLMTKVYIPKYIFPLSKTLFIGINFLITLIPLLLLIIFSGSGETKCYININYLVLPYVFICLYLFTTGVGFILASISVFFRDMFYIYGIIVTILMYLTPIMYDISQISIGGSFAMILRLNPLYRYIDFARVIILKSQMPSLSSFLICGISGLAVFLLGLVVFKANQNKFIYYI